MFKATAYVVGPTDGPGAAVSDMARNIGFETVLPFAGPAVAEQQTARTPLIFFLFAARSLVYYETPTYFGPDRRRGAAPTAEEKRNAIANRVRRFEIVRTVSSGVNILRDDARAA